MPQPLRQAAVLAFRNGKVCLVTTRTQKNWVLPKGHIEAEHTPQEAAEREAWEEAGLRGLLDEEPIGQYSYEKNGRPHRVTVFRMTVNVVHDIWPERLLRTRHWVSLEEAVERIKNKELKALLAAVVVQGNSKSEPSPGGILQ